MIAGTRTAAAAAVLLVAAALPHVAAGADSPSGALLGAADATLTWTGSFEDNAGASVPDLYQAPGTCPALGCQEYSVEVDLPAGTWDTPGGVQIAIDWFPLEENDLDLYIYGPDGALAGRSDGVVASTGESVRLPRAANGTYRAVVVPRLVVGPMDYRGFVEVEREPAPDPQREMLPNLVSVPPRHPMLRTGAYFADHDAEGTPSCYPEEMAERGARRCLRFDQIIANHGEGPFELRYRMEGLATDQQLRQRIYASDGSFTDVKADTYEFHPTHAHFHYKGFGRGRLFRPLPDGTRELVRESGKNGFCMIDVENTRFGLDAGGRPHRGEAPRTYYFPRCNAPTERDDHGTSMVNGIAVGWADVYNWFLADQYIEITGVPDGIYIIETEANPENTVRETTKDDNKASTTIRLTGDTVEVVPGG